MRVIVTGGLGFLGRAAAQRLAKAGHQVLALDVSPSDLMPGLETGLCDVTDRQQVDAAFRRYSPHAVIHLAALLTPATRGDIVAATQVNALGTAHVLASAKGAGAKRVVYASSVAALGVTDASDGDAALLQPASVYGATKAFGEHLAAALAHDDPSMSFVTLRFGWVYGPGRHRGWREVQAVIEAAARGDSVIEYPDFPDAIDWTWVDDAAEVILRAATAQLASYHAFNVAGDKRRMREAAAYLERRFPDLVMRPVPATTPPSAWGFRNDALVPCLGYQPGTRMEAGIDRLIESLGGRTAGP